MVVSDRDGGPGRAPWVHRQGGRRLLHSVLVFVRGPRGHGCRGRDDLGRRPACETTGCARKCFAGRADFAFRLVPAPPSAAGATARFRYQICNDVTGVCYPPMVLRIPGAPGSGSCDTDGQRIKTTSHRLRRLAASGGTARARAASMRRTLSAMTALQLAAQTFQNDPGSSPPLNTLNAYMLAQFVGIAQGQLTWLGLGPGRLSSVELSRLLPELGWMARD